jgi:hypothetical protein
MKKINYVLVSAISIALTHSAFGFDPKLDYKDEFTTQAEKDAKAAQGINVGSFTLSPLLGLDEQYDTNIYRLDSRRGNVKDSFVTHFRPGFDLRSNWNQHELGLSLNTDITEYSTQSDNNNYHDLFLKATGRLDVLQNSFLKTAFTWDDVHETRGSPDQTLSIGPTFYDKKALDLSYVHKPNRFSLTPGFIFNRYDYQNPSSSAAPGGILLMTSRNHWEYAPSFKLGYEIQPSYEAFAKFIWKEINYDNAVYANGNTAFSPYFRNSRGFSATGGLEYQISDLITGDASVGYVQRDYYNDPRLSSISTVTGFINTNWHPTTLTSVLFNFSRDILETTQAGVSGIVATGPGVTLEHELLRNVILTAGGDYKLLNYQGFNNAAPSFNTFNRADDLYSGTAGFKYIVNRYFTTGLNYTYLGRSSNYNLSNYSANQVLLNLNLQL